MNCPQEYHFHIEKRNKKYFALYLIKYEKGKYSKVSQGKDFLSVADAMDAIPALGEGLGIEVFPLDKAPKF